jgi:hypothetical protein
MLCVRVLANACTCVYVHAHVRPPAWCEDVRVRAYVSVRERASMCVRPRGCLRLIESPLAEVWVGPVDSDSESSTTAPTLSRCRVCWARRSSSPTPSVSSFFFFCRSPGSACSFINFSASMPALFRAFRTKNKPGVLQISSMLCAGTTGTMRTKYVSWSKKKGASYQPAAQTSLKVGN